MESRKQYGEKSISPLNPLKVPSARGGGACNSLGSGATTYPLSVCAFVIRSSSDHSTNPLIWRTGSFLPTLASIKCVQSAPGISTLARGGEWVAAAVLKAEIDQS